MKKNPLTRALFVAGALAMAGAAAQADAIFYPDGTMADLGESQQVALNDTSIDTVGTMDTTVLGAPASVTTTTTTTTVPAYEYVYVQPNIDFDRHAVVAQMRGERHVAVQTNVLGAGAAPHDRDNFNVPARAGEASTMTNGAPNLLTSNDSYMVGSTAIPYSVLVVDQPYYVLSY